MLVCLDREGTAAVSVVDYVASGVDYEVRPTEDAQGMGVVDTLPAVATFRTRICIKTTRARTSRRVDTAERMMGGILEGTVAGTVRGVTSQSQANKSWFAM